MPEKYDGYGRLTEYGRSEQDKEDHRRRLVEEANQPQSTGSGMGCILLLPLVILYVKYAINSMVPWMYWTVVFGVPFLAARSWFKRNTTEWGAPPKLAAQCIGAMLVMSGCLHWFLQQGWQDVIGYFALVIVGGVVVVLVGSLFLGRSH